MKNLERIIKISIIVPVYNVERYIRECFESIAAQTYEGELECIFVDDCGQDGSMALLERLIASYKGNIQFSILHHEHNRGLSAARNTGIEHATCDYLYFLDSDDSITPDCIERLAALAEKYSGVDIVQGSARCTWKALSMKGKNAPEFSNDAAWIRIGFLRRSTIPVTAWNKLVRTELIKEYQLYFEEGLIHEDDLWSFLLSKHVKSIAFCEEETYLYRENAAGIMGTIQDRTQVYIPVLTSISKNISGPDVCTELFCFADFAQACGEGKYSVERFLTNIAYNNCLLEKLLHIRTIAKHNPKTSIKGFISRIMLVPMKLLVNATFPKRR